MYKFTQCRKVRIFPEKRNAYFMHKCGEETGRSTYTSYSAKRIEAIRKDQSVQPLLLEASIPQAA